MHYVRLSINALCQVMFFFFTHVFALQQGKWGLKMLMRFQSYAYWPKSIWKKSKGCDESIFEYISSGNVENTDSLYAKLVEELERCILSYLAFHWNQATSVISQVC